MAYIGNRLAAALLHAAPVLLVAAMYGVGRLTPKLSCKRSAQYATDLLGCTLDRRSTATPPHHLALVGCSATSGAGAARNHTGREAVDRDDTRAERVPLQLYARVIADRAQQMGGRVRRRA
jgi:hypothetical protein